MKVRYLSEDDKYWAELVNFGHRYVHVPERYVREYDRLLMGGIWAQVNIRHDYDESVKGKRSPFWVEDIKPMQAMTTHNAMHTPHPLRKVLSLRDFRLLFAGGSTSLLGDQFPLIATPWLVLQLTGDPLALGIVLALKGVPRALFMLFGGAVTDRFSPRVIMLAADIARLVLAALIAVAVLTGAVQIWMLYAFALGFGLVAGFAVPAGNSIVPLLVEEQDLQAGNSLMMGAGQLVGFVGPVVAGILIGSFAESLFGVGRAFGIDAAPFAFPAIMLLLMRGGGRLPKLTTDAPAAAAQENIGEAIMPGLKYVWEDRALRLIFLVIAAVNFLFVGPILVGVPVLADQRLSEGAVAFGLLMSGFAGETITNRGLMRPGA